MKSLCSLGVVALAASLLVLPLSARADDWHHGGSDHGHGPPPAHYSHDNHYHYDGHSHTTVYFGVNAGWYGGWGAPVYYRPWPGWDRWPYGHWYHVTHNGALAWWWVVDGLWYSYPVPVYPYPVPVYNPAPAAPAYDYQASNAPPPAPGNAAPPPAQSWYYCESLKGYYPYVRSCPEGWREVPATPPGAH